ncbi:tetratricopeptide repeat protein [Streptomyces mirabilis]
MTSFASYALPEPMAWARGVVNDGGMGWGKLRPWLALIGPLLAVVVLTAAPAGVKAGELSWPKWLVAGLVAAGGVLVAAWAPLVKARTEALAARATRAAERDAQAEEALSRLPTLKGRVPLVADVTDRALLDIHEAIPLPGDILIDIDQDLSSELPTYVPRDIDADLRTALEARSKTGGFVLLVGPAASGKTRCAYEAIRSALPHWRLFMPGDAATVTELVSSGTDLKHSVLWLNETQDFLTGPDRLKASTVRRLLADTARPVILIGTIWPTTYDQLRTPATSSDGESGEVEDLNRDAREVLKLARRFLLGTWSDQEWERAEELASIDPRIGQATRHRGQMGLAQMLSAAPELIHRWEQADNPLSQAVITAAVVARRCGHPAAVTAAIIEGLAEEFLTDAERVAADGPWMTEALKWACSPVHNGGGIAPLQAVGAVLGQIDGYRISDILVDHEASTAPVTDRQITPRVWERLTDLATPEACDSIGNAAYFAGMPAHARAAWERAAGTGDADPMSSLGLLLREMGDLDGAGPWLQRAAEAGNTAAMNNLGSLLTEQGDSDAARTWFARAVDAGVTTAMWNLGVLLSDEGDVEGARAWWQRAADGGHPLAMYNLGVYQHKEQGDLDGAITWWQLAAEAGHALAMSNLGSLLAMRGDTEGARTWFIRAVEAGVVGAMYNLGVLLRDQGDLDGAITWWQLASEAGDSEAQALLQNLNRAEE